MIRVLVVEDVTLVADAIRLVLRREPDIRVVAAAPCSAEALKHARDADIALVNIHLDDGAALRLVEMLSQFGGSLKVVMMGVSSPEEELLPFLDLGISGYVLSSSDLEVFVETLRMVHRGEAVVSPRLAATLMSRLAQLARASDRPERPAGASPVDVLTARELEVVALIGRGFSNQEIADHLLIEVGTVKNHVHNILSKLNVSSRRAAASLVASKLGVQRVHESGSTPLVPVAEPEIRPRSRRVADRRMPA